MTLTGWPGSGKTSLLLELAKYVVTRCDYMPFSDGVITVNCRGCRSAPQMVGRLWTGIVRAAGGRSGMSLIRRLGISTRYYESMLRPSPRKRPGSNRESSYSDYHRAPPDPKEPRAEAADPEDPPDEDPVVQGWFFEQPNDGPLSIGDLESKAFGEASSVMSAGGRSISGGSLAAGRFEESAGSRRRSLVETTSGRHPNTTKLHTPASADLPKPAGWH